MNQPKSAEAHTIENPLKLEITDAWYSIMNPPITKITGSVEPFNLQKGAYTLVSRSIAIELQAENDKLNKTLTDQGKMYNELNQEKEGIQHHRDELYDETILLQAEIEHLKKDNRVLNLVAEEIQVMHDFWKKSCYDPDTIENLRIELEEQKQLIASLAKALKEADKQLYELMEHCIDNHYIDPEDESDGTIQFNNCREKNLSELAKYNESIKTKD